MLKKLTATTASAIFIAMILSGLVFIFGKPTPDTNQTQNTTTPDTQSEDTHVYKTTYYQVLKIIDGDTIDVNIDGKTERLRLIGIDTPETVKYNNPVECFGPEATEKAKELLLNQKVRLEADPSQDDRDAYDRLLRYVYRDDGLFFNEWMIANGYSREFTFIYPYKYQSEFKQAQINAQNGELGLWESGVCD